MKITLLGNGRADYCSERDYEWTLRKLGHEVIFLQETEVSGERVLAESLDADALFWIHTWHWKTPGMPMSRVLSHLRMNNVPSFAYHLDLMMTRERINEFRTSGYNDVDHFFTVEKDFADYLNNQKTWTKGYYLPPGVVERDCFLAEPEEKYEYDVIFSGSYDYRHPWPYRRQLLDWLRGTYKERFHRYGRPYKDQPDAEYIMGAELNKVYASAKIVVGDTFCEGFKKTHYWSNRTPETLGKGGFLIHPRIEGMQEYFTDKKHLVFYEYGNFAELKLLIDYYLDHPDERETIRRAGHEEVKANHTFTNRLTHMLETIQ